MKKRMIAVLKVTLFTLLLMSICTQQADAREPYEIEIYTNINGTSTYIQGVALADLINQHSDWLRAMALESPGPSESAMMIINMPAMRTKAIAYVIIQDALLGLPPFSGPYEDFRTFASYGLVSNGYMTNNPDIKTLYDLEGKRVALGTRPNMPRVDIQEEMFKLMGINIRAEYLTFNDAVTALSDRRVDAIIGGGFAYSPNYDVWAPNPSMAELLARNEITFISYEPKEYLIEAKKNLGHDLMPGVLTVPAGKYHSSCDYDLNLMCDYLGWSSHKDMPDEVIQEIMRIMADYSHRFVDYLPNGGYVTPETMAMLDTPEYIHPAAEAFYNERGIPIRPRQ